MKIKNKNKWIMFFYNLKELEHAQTYEMNSI